MNTTAIGLFTFSVVNCQHAVAAGELLSVT